MSDLVQAVKDGKVVTSTSSSSSTASSSSTSKSGSTLDKNAFLKLLVTQMKYQDPLNPSTDTEYVAQLATFSQLEQLQNLSTAATTSQAFGLVGKNVTVTTENSTGNTSTISGKVDFVSMSNGTAKISINGSLYSLDDLTSVIDDDYITEQNSPSITQATELKYDASNPTDQTFDVNLGSGDTTADDVAVAINGNVVDTNLVNVKNGKVTIDKSAFENLENGTYKATVVFNDSNYTTVKDKVTVQVSNSTVTDSTDTGSTASDSSTSSDTTASATGA